MSPLLPREFADLEPFVATWSLASEADRYEQRMSSSMAEMQAFYDAVAPRADAAIAYCDRFPFDELPEDALRLLHLVYSLITVSFAVEVWLQPRVPDSGSTSLPCFTEPVP